nr:uncharacterized protein LOC105489282 isoform X2 [Macaca nemestrina]
MLFNSKLWKRRVTGTAQPTWKDKELFLTIRIQTPQAPGLQCHPGTFPTGQAGYPDEGTSAHCGFASPHRTFDGSPSCCFSWSPLLCPCCLHMLFIPGLQERLPPPPSYRPRLELTASSDSTASPGLGHTLSGRLSALPSPCKARIPGVRAAWLHSRRPPCHASGGGGSCGLGTAKRKRMPVGRRTVKPRLQITSLPTLVSL